MALANVTMDVLYPEFWASAFDNLDKGDYNLQNFVNRSVEGQLAQYGDTVNVPIVDSISASDWTPGSTITPSNSTGAVKQVVLNKSKNAVKGFTDKELTMSPYDLINNYGQAMAEGILAAVNSDIYTEAITSTKTVVGTTLTADVIADAETALNTNKASKKGRILVGAPDAIGTLRKIAAFQDASKSNNDSVIKEGAITRQFGFDIYENSAIPSTTGSLLAFAPEGLAFAARGYTALNKPGVNSSIINVAGLPIRISVWTDSATLNTLVQYDILYGVKLVNENRVIEITRA